MLRFDVGGDHWLGMQGTSYMLGLTVEIDRRSSDITIYNEDIYHTKSWP